MPNTTGTLELKTPLSVVRKTDTNAIITPSISDAAIQDFRLSAGFEDDVTPDQEPYPNSLYQTIYDVHFTKLSDYASVPLFNSQGQLYTDQELFMLAAEQLFGFETGRADGVYNLNRVITDITDVSAFLSIDAFFDIPFMLSNWEADRTFYSPNWTYWVPLIQQNLATPEQAWTETLKAINDAGVSVRYGNFKDTIDIGWDEAIATPEPESMILFITGLICLFSVRATRLDLIR